MGRRARSSALILASLVAGLATTPYAAYHFHRLAPYGVLANLLAMPVVSAWVMPMGILGVLAMPFGFDALFWQLMGAGHRLDDRRRAVGRASARRGRPHCAPSVPDRCCLATAGLLLLCLLRTPLRWSGAVLAAVATVWAVTAPQPDVLVAGDGRAAAIRGADGRLAVLASGRDTFAVKEWLMADGDARAPNDPSLHDGMRCDAIGCIGQLADGRLVAMTLSVEAFAEDCARAAVVVERARGAARLRRQADRPQGLARARRHRAALDRRSLRGCVARPPGYDRPWARAPPVASETPQPSSPRDATPRQADLEAGD